jgi:hypothetical protein
LLPSFGVAIVSPARLLQVFNRPAGEYTVAPVEPPSDATTADCADNVTACDDNSAAAVAAGAAVGTYG